MLDRKTLQQDEKQQQGHEPGNAERQPDQMAGQAMDLLPDVLEVDPGAYDPSPGIESADMGELGQRMIDFYAPVVSSENLVAYLYVMLTGTVATSEQVQGFVDQVGVGKTFETQGALFAFAASLELNTVELVGFAGGLQALDPTWF